MAKTTEVRTEILEHLPLDSKLNNKRFEVKVSFKLDLKAEVDMWRTESHFFRTRREALRYLELTGLAE